MKHTDLLKTAQNLPLHDPARGALMDACHQIIGLRQSLQYANAALLASQTDRANLLCACARIAHGVGSAEDYSKTAKDAIAGLCDRAAEEVDKQLDLRNSDCVMDAAGYYNKLAESIDNPNRID